MATYQLVDLAERIQGVIKGDPNQVISAVGGVEHVPVGGLTFAEDERHLRRALESPASAVLTRPQLPIPPESSKAFLLHPNPRWAWAQILTLYDPTEHPPIGIHPTVIIGEACEWGDEVAIASYVVLGNRVRLGHRVKIYPFCYIGDEVQIGDDCIVYPHVTVMARSVLGQRVILHSGVVIGADGYGYLQQDGTHHKIPQIGCVVLEDDVEIGANTTIDRATTGETRIGKGTKIDNLVQIGHNVQIGEHCLLVSQVGIAGSTTIGNHVVLAGQVGVKDHVQIGDHVVVGAQGGVSKSLPAGGVYWGTPAIPHREWLQILAHLYRLPELVQRVGNLEHAHKDRNDR